MSGDLRREIVFEPGYDHRAEDANKPRGQRRGCHGLTMRWLVHGEHGTTSFTVFTGWLPSWVKPGRWGDVVTAPDGEPAHAPMAADLGHHWDSPTYSGEGSMECHYRPSGRCFYNGSGLNAEPVFAALLTKGHEAVWEMLENYYRHLVEAAEATLLETS